MTTRSERIVSAAIALITLLPFGCRRQEAPAPSPTQSAAKPTPQDVDKALLEASERDRLRFAGMTFEQFKESAGVYKEPFEGGKYIVNGDTPILGDKQLQEFFETKVKLAPPPPSIRRQVELAVGHVGGLDLAWNQQMQMQLEYCVSKPGFGARYDAVEKVLHLRPRLRGDFRAFLAVAGGYGTVGVRAGQPFFEPVAGRPEVREIRYDAAA